MKIEILKENLKNSLSILERIVGKNLSLPILNNVYISAEDNFLSMSSTDLETAIKLWVLTKVVKKGNAVSPIKFLSSFVSLLPNEKIIIEEKNQTLEVECKNFKTKIQGQNPEDFPLIPVFENLDFLEVDNKKLCQGLAQVVDVASLSATRPEIAGIYFNFSKNILKIVATDSFRLAEKTITLENAVKKDVSFIIPQKPAKEIVNILNERDGNIKAFISTSQIMFEFPMKDLPHPQFQIISRLVEGEYPNYQAIIPGKFKTHIILKRDDFLNQIKTASLFSGKISEVKITVNKDKGDVEIFSKDPDIGENKSTILAKITGEDQEVSFNYKFLIDGLNNIKSSEVIFELSEKEGPCVLKPVGDLSYLYVVMPIKST